MGEGVICYKGRQYSMELVSALENRLKEIGSIDIEKTNAYYNILCQCYDEIREKPNVAVTIRRDMNDVLMIIDYYDDIDDMVYTLFSFLFPGNTYITVNSAKRIDLKSDSIFIELNSLNNIRVSINTKLKDIRVIIS